MLIAERAGPMVFSIFYLSQRAISERESSYSSKNAPHVPGTPSQEVLQIPAGG